MFARISPSNDSGFHIIDRAPPIDEEKRRQLLFEQATNQVITTTITNIPRLVLEIIGINNTTCNAFEELRNNSGFFCSNVSINREITFLLCLCNIKHMYEDVSCIPAQLNPSIIREWLNQITGHTELSAELKSSWIESVKVYDGKITFTYSIFHRIHYHSIKLSKLNMNMSNAFGVVKTSSSKLDLNVRYYSNLQGIHCAGMSQVFLLTMGISYGFPPHIRRDIKSRYIQSLAVNPRTGSLSDSQIYYLSQAEVGISHSSFFYLQDIYSTAFSIGRDIGLVVELMQVNRQTQLWSSLIAYDHIMVIGLIEVGNFIKIFVYDPNDEGLYKSMLVDPALDNSQAITDMIYLLNYFLHSKENYPLILKCYCTSNSGNRNVSLVGDNFGVFSNGVSIEDIQLIKLGVQLNELRLLQQGIHRYLSLVSSGIRQPLSIEHPNLLFDVIEISKYYYQKYNQDIIRQIAHNSPGILNQINADGLTPLDYALSQNARYTVQTLVELGASKNICAGGSYNSNLKRIPC